MKPRTAFAEILALLFLSSWASAVSPAEDVNQLPEYALEPRDQDVAVVIGIEKYNEDLHLPPSAYSASDAKLVYEYLLKLGFPENNIEHIYDGQATLGRFKKTLNRWLPDHIKPNSRVFFYYSGHGAPDAITDPTKPEAYLVPADGDPSDLRDTAYPLNVLYQKLNDLKASQVIVVVDACFSGEGKHSVLAPHARPLIAGGALPRADVPARMAVLTATQPNQISTSSEEKKHGVLTYRFLQALKEGTSNMVDIFHKIQPLVRDDAHREGVTQSPTLLTSDDNRKFPLVDPQAIRDAIEKIRAEKERLKKEEEEKEAALRASQNTKELEEKKRQFEEQQRQLEEKQRQLEAQQRADQERQRQLEQQQRQMEAQREADRQRNEAERRRLERERRNSSSGEGAYVPPTF